MSTPDTRPLIDRLYDRYDRDTLDVWVTGAELAELRAHHGEIIRRAAKGRTGTMFGLVMVDDDIDVRLIDAYEVEGADGVYWRVDVSRLFDPRAFDEVARWLGESVAPRLQVNTFDGPVWFERATDHSYVVQSNDAGLAHDVVAVRVRR